MIFARVKMICARADCGVEPFGQAFACHTGGDSCDGTNDSGQNAKTSISTPCLLKRCTGFSHNIISDVEAMIFARRYSGGLHGVLQVKYYNATRTMKLVTEALWSEGSM